MSSRHHWLFIYDQGSRSGRALQELSKWPSYTLSMILACTGDMLHRQMTHNCTCGGLALLLSAVGLLQMAEIYRIYCLFGLS